MADVDVDVDVESIHEPVTTAVAGGRLDWFLSRLHCRDGSPMNVPPAPRGELH
jgi:hypothetical protein